MANKKSLMKGKGFGPKKFKNQNTMLTKFKNLAGKVGHQAGFVLKSSIQLVCNDSSSSEESDEDDVLLDTKNIMAQPDLPPEFWQVQKLVWYSQF